MGLAQAVYGSGACVGEVPGEAIAVVDGVADSDSVGVCVAGLDGVDELDVAAFVGFARFGGLRLGVSLADDVSHGDCDVRARLFRRGGGDADVLVAGVLRGDDDFVADVEGSLALGQIADGYRSDGGYVAYGGYGELVSRLPAQCVGGDQLAVLG